MNWLDAMIESPYEMSKVTTQDEEGPVTYYRHNSPNWFILRNGEVLKTEPCKEIIKLSRESLEWQPVDGLTDDEAEIVTCVAHLPKGLAPDKMHIYYAAGDKFLNIGKTKVFYKFVK